MNVNIVRRLTTRSNPKGIPLGLTENTVDDFAARKKPFREMATRSAHIVSGDLAVRRRSTSLRLEES